MEEPVVIVNVDDNDPARYAKTRVLTRAGFRVYDARTGAEGLELAATRMPDLVLLDVNLPDINGIEVCRKLKSSLGSAGVMVLQISAHAIAAPHAAAALNSGADSYLTEPVDPDVLVATIRALLRLRRAERALAASNEELRRSNEDLQQFATVASHDLQEPLRNVISFSNLLERSAQSRLTEEEREYLGYITQGALRMHALIADLLRYSQVGQAHKEMASVDLRAVMQWAVDNLQQPILETGATVRWSGLPVVSGDETQLRHLMQNLVGNAVKYRNPEVVPDVTVSAERKQNEWIIRVRDNGIGIAPEYHDVVFAPFRRLHGKNIPGTGIGLALCRRVVELHGGDIWLDSKPGQGSTFSFTLPGIEVEGQAKPADTSGEVSDSAEPISTR
jgi:two-component system sensor histidine kinase/response regulator